MPSWVCPQNGPLPSRSGSSALPQCPRQCVFRLPRPGTTWSLPLSAGGQRLRGAVNNGHPLHLREPTFGSIRRHSHELELIQAQDDCQRHRSWVLAVGSLRDHRSQGQTECLLRENIHMGVLLILREAKRRCLKSQRHT